MTAKTPVHQTISSSQCAVLYWRALGIPTSPGLVKLRRAPPQPQKQPMHCEAGAFKGAPRAYDVCTIAPITLSIHRAHPTSQSPLTLCGSYSFMRCSTGTSISLLFFPEPATALATLKAETFLLSLCPFEAVYKLPPATEVLIQGHFVLLLKAQYCTCTGVLVLNPSLADVSYLLIQKY